MASPSIACWACCNASPSSTSSASRSGSARATRLTSQALRVGLRRAVICLASSFSPASLACLASAVRRAMKSSGEMA